MARMQNERGGRDGGTRDRIVEKLVAINRVARS